MSHEPDTGTQSQIPTPSFNLYPGLHSEQCVLLHAKQPVNVSTHLMRHLSFSFSL